MTNANSTLEVETAIQDYEASDGVDTGNDNNGCLSLAFAIAPLILTNIFDLINNPSTSTQVINKILRF